MSQTTVAKLSVLKTFLFPHQALWTYPALQQKKYLIHQTIQNLNNLCSKSKNTLMLILWIPSQNFWSYTSTFPQRFPRFSLSFPEHHGIIHEYYIIKSVHIAYCCNNRTDNMRPITHSVSSRVVIWYLKVSKGCSEKYYFFICLGGQCHRQQEILGCLGLV